ncbi:MAG: hypothetical protein AAF713_21000 [Pseudomonadota bacterium]
MQSHPSISAYQASADTFVAELEPHRVRLERMDETLQPAINSLSVVQDAGIAVDATLARAEVYASALGGTADALAAATIDPDARLGARLQEKTEVRADFLEASHVMHEALGPVTTPVEGVAEEVQQALGALPIDEIESAIDQATETFKRIGNAFDDIEKALCQTITVEPAIRRSRSRTCSACLSW